VTLPEDWSSWRASIDLDAYEARWEQMAAAGGDPHGEADLVASFGPASVLDAGCGTGRVAIELARRGVTVVGVDVDPDMVERARAKAPDLTWHVADLASLDLHERFDLVVLAGNVVPYVPEPDRAAAVAACARHLVPGGLLVAGFTSRPGWPAPADYDAWCERAGLEPAHRWSSWDRAPYSGGDYLVAVHRRR
jgi:SAM-dependent methyltransferase